MASAPKRCSFSCKLQFCKLQYGAKAMNSNYILALMIYKTAVILMLIVSLAQSATLKVGPGESLSATLYTARPGDVVEVKAGTYYDHLTIDKPITLLGIGMPVLDATASGSAITITANGVWVQGFRIINSGSLQGGNGAGISVRSDNNTITGNNVSNNFNGIYLSKANSNRIFRNFVSDNLGFGIRLESSSNNTIWENIFANNYGQNTYDNGNNMWDNGTVGNYHSDFVCSDKGNITCGSGCAISGGNGIDRYPLIKISLL
jgi:parallel beta-helix repeat protein